MIYPRMVVRAAAHKLQLPLKHVQWLEDNWEIWDEFCKIAEVVRVKSGRERFGAFAVINVLRWNRMLSDKTDKRFKISNGCAPVLARLYNMVYSVDLFELRPAPTLEEKEVKVNLAIMR